MASISTRRLLQRSAAAVKASLSRNGKSQLPTSVSSGRTSNIGGLAPPPNPSPSSRPRRPFSTTRFNIHYICFYVHVCMHNCNIFRLCINGYVSILGDCIIWVFYCLSKLMRTLTNDRPNPNTQLQRAQLKSEQSSMQCSKTRI